MSKSRERSHVARAFPESPVGLDALPAMARGLALEVVAEGVETRWREWSSAEASEVAASAESMA